MNLLTHLSEGQFLDMIITRARARQWLVHHDRPAPTKDRNGRWITHTVGDPGFPDLVMAKAGRCIFAEVKTETGRISPAQRVWIEALNGAVWRPSDWPAICEILDS